MTNYSEFGPKEENVLSLIEKNINQTDCFNGKRGLLGFSISEAYMPPFLGEYFFLPNLSKLRTFLSGENYRT